FQVAAHEIGHALGLDHTAVANSLMNPFYSEAFSGPQADDIQGIQALYGGGSPSAPLPAPLLFWLAGLLVMGWRLRDRFS
ncbi:MAG: matrixin family metalloprotease, partial [Magnetococcales bacterium]|nr:matrixin family metalloprotease [Magnetococcales bacterium]